MTVRLNPVEFGELQVNVRIENQQVKVEIITDNRTVRDALMGNLDALKETFQKQNLTMERFDVSSGGGNGSGQGFREERGEQQRINPIMSGHEAASFETAREQVEDDWGGTENSLVNLRL
jgi:flagellar hook-length control protein FliK